MIHRKMIIYNLFPLLAGKFREWERHLARASEMGFNWVFVNTVQRPGRSGSIYSIEDYFSINPLLADKNRESTPEEQLTHAIETAENYGMKMIVDLVINHCSIDSELLKMNPAWFEWEGKGRVAHPFAMHDREKVVWKDLAKFDFKNTADKEGLYQYCLKIVKYLVGLGFKGLRCDAAYQVPRSDQRNTGLCT